MNIESNRSDPISVSGQSGGECQTSNVVHHPLPVPGPLKEREEQEAPPCPAHPAADTSAVGLGVLPLLVWLSPSFPVGSFAFSHGLEWAIAADDIRDAAALRGWLSDLLTHGSARNDAILLSAVWRAVRAGDGAQLADINELALALAGSRERHLDTSAQGNAFLAAIKAAWPHKKIDGLEQGVDGAIAYPAAVALAAAAHGLELRATLESYLVGIVSNLVSVAVRLAVIGQSDGQRVIAVLLPAVHDLAHAAEQSTLDDVGGAAFRSDLAALRHETLYTRLFRS